MVFPTSIEPGTFWMSLHWAAALKGTELKESKDDWPSNSKLTLLWHSRHCVCLEYCKFSVKHVCNDSWWVGLHCPTAVTALKRHSPKASKSCSMWHRIGVRGAMGRVDQGEEDQAWEKHGTSKEGLHHILCSFPEHFPSDTDILDVNRLFNQHKSK